METVEVSGFQLASRKALCWLPILLGTSGLTAQTCLVLSPAPGASTGTALLKLSLYSSPGTPPAAIQWTFQYASSNIHSLTVDDGPMLTAAGKMAMCAGNAAAYNCLAVGVNKNTIPSGVIAMVTAVLAPGASTAAISITNALAASAAGDVIPISPKIVSVTNSNISSDCRLHPPLRGSAVGR
jgi:hypothetical protein